jgi:hypothetical protein
MARLVLAAIAGVVVGCTAGAALDISAREPTEEVVALALEASVDPYELEAAAATVGVSPRTYAYGTGLLAPPVPQRDGIDRLIDCLEWHESRGYAGAVNPRSGASGPLQYLHVCGAELVVQMPYAARVGTVWMPVLGGSA